MKQVCTKCKVEKSVDEFNWKKKGVKRRYMCRECTKEKGRQHYLKNKQAYLDNVNKNRNALKEWFKDYKSTLSCEICGEDRTPCLDFHHVDSTTKEKAIAEAVHNNWSIKKLKEEIDKCMVVCRNCHAMIHHDEKIQTTA